ncbi:terminase small subunit [Lelliottia sp. SL45]|uniref:terminase small subunit n=1 Tax=Lelliottia sp. SL45 TaxID=2994665 RepID=UPI00227467CA|nr:terminase small subunit [Lelliottia sp. SL45]MCY1698649.1 terminase small subunit [Lelliottia sp. SL45]
MAVLLNKRDMAASIGISVQAFDKWGVEPVERRGREVFYDVRVVLEHDRKKRMQQMPDEEDGEDLEKKLLLARISLTEEQASAQHLKNLKEEKLVVDTAFCTFALSRLANDIASVLDTIPLSMQRRFIEMDEIQLNYLKALIAKAMNAAVMTSEKIPEALDEYLSSTD